MTNHTPQTDLARHLLKQLGWSQRYAAFRLEMQERQFRAMLAGKEHLPLHVIYALEHLTRVSPSDEK